ncbi:hypothetical protein AB2T90_11210 [Clostridium butyricum]|uniref:hypothetical protein n=1 Tax=Clostridium butyricum TaxID=1492 RepID=UPI0034662837
MNKELINKTITEDKTIDSREVAEMMGKEHKDIIRMIDGYEPPIDSKKKRIVGILPTLAKGNFTPMQLFYRIQLFYQ